MLLLQFWTSYSVMLLLSEKWSESVLQLISLRPWQSSIYSLFACFLVCNSRTLSFLIRFFVNLLCPVQTVKSEEASNSNKMYSQCVVCAIHVWKMCSRCGADVITSFKVQNRWYMKYMYSYGFLKVLYRNRPMIFCAMDNMIYVHVLYVWKQFLWDDEKKNGLN